jgi:uncharacterized membrane protein (TIGR02234 family)
VLIALVASAATVLLGSTQVWIDASLTVSGLPTVDVAANGRTVAPLAPAVALLTLGAAAALLLLGGAARRFVGAIAAVMALLGTWVCIRTALDPASAVGPVLAETAGITGLSDVSAPTLAVRGWPWIVAAALFVAALGGAVAALSPRWPSVGRRYASRESGRPPIGGERARDDGVGLWDALDRGDDPTL